MARAAEVRPGQTWIGRGASLGRAIRIIDIQGGVVSFDVIEGYRTSRPIRLATLWANYVLSIDPRQDPVADNGERLTIVEGQVIASLHRLADRWPQTLKVVIVNGCLRVMHADQPVRDSSVLAKIGGIPGE